MELIDDIVGFHRAWMLDAYDYASLAVFEAFGHAQRRLVTADDDAATAETSGLMRTLYANIVVFVIIAVAFESARSINRLYVCRRTRQRVKRGRVPDSPSGYPMKWLSVISKVSDDDFLYMAGLDAYIMLRYIKACIKVTLFYTLCGMIVLMPVYYTGKANQTSNWEKYTIANVRADPEAKRLWAAVVMAYILAGAFCTIMREEYKHFLERRVEYFDKGGDKDTPLQTYYTVMVDRIPPRLRNKAALHAFFERMLPGQVYSLEMAYDLTELDRACRKRRDIRDALEDAIALWRGSSLASVPLDEHRPHSTEWFGCAKQTTVPSTTEPCCCGYLQAQRYDSIDYWAAELTKANDEVVQLQSAYFSGKAVMECDGSNLSATETMLARMEVEFKAGLAGLKLPTSIIKKQFTIFRKTLLRKEQEIRMESESHAAAAGASGETSGLTATLLPNEYKQVPVPSDANGGMSKMEISVTGSTPCSLEKNNTDSPLHDSEDETAQSPSNDGDIFIDVPTPKKPGQQADRSAAPTEAPADDSSEPSTAGGGTTDTKKSLASVAWHAVGDVVGGVAHTVGDAVGEFANEGGHVGKAAFMGIFSSIRTGLRDLEMLTYGSHYKTSSTAFVTFKSRVACSMAYQMFLSTEFYSIKVYPAPQPGDIQWDNVNIAEDQVDARKSVADTLFFIGALFWSVVVSFIATISNLDDLATRYSWIAEYKDTYFYTILNSYLAALLLIIVLAILPFIFYFCAKFYEGIKLESKIQQSVMTRYFWYQLVNVIVSVNLGSVLTNLAQIIESPEQIFTILGVAVPSFSVYFTNLIIVKTFTAIPIEMLRPWPLLQMFSLKMFINEKRCSWRYLHTGLFAPPVMDYAWIYPSLLMILMIINIYACIAPAVVPFALVYFIFVFYMYKYQLLYVFQNDYQSGGHLFMQLFNYTMMSLMVGTLTVLAYFAILRSFLSAPFYCLMPLPLLVYWYQNDCIQRYMGPSLQMSLKRSVDIDEEYKRYVEVSAARDRDLANNVPPPTHTLTPKSERESQSARSTRVTLNEDSGTIQQEAAGVETKTDVAEFYIDEEVPLESFRENLFVQPSLVEGISNPMPYRKANDMSTLADVHTVQQLENRERSSAFSADKTVPAGAQEDKGRPSDLPVFTNTSQPSGADKSGRTSLVKRTSERYDTTEQFFGQEEAVMDDSTDEPVGVEEDFTSRGVWEATAQADDNSNNGDTCSDNVV